MKLAVRSYDYWPDAERRRFALRDTEPHEQPTVRWDEHALGDGLGSEADEATGFGWGLPSCLLAALFLDAGHPEVGPNQFSLEGPHGFGGASLASAQVQLYVSDEPWGWRG